MTHERLRRGRVTVVGLCGMSALLRVDRFPAPGETVQAPQLLYEVGGKGMNQAVAAHRMGAEVRFFTAVGDDGFAAPIRSDCNAIGFFACRVAAKPNVPSAFAAVSVDANGENTVTVCRGACGAVSPADMDALEDWFAESDVVLLQLELPLPAVEHAAALAKRHGAYVLLNTAPAQPLPQSLVASVDLITPNRNEAAMLAGLGADASPEALVQALRGKGYRDIVITLGKDGAVLARAGENPILYPAFPVRCIDTVGAGDTFSGTLAARLAHGEPLDSACVFASAASALSVKRAGVVASIPQRAEVAKFLASHPSPTPSETVPIL